MRDILLLGSTGSIGTQTLDVIRRSAGALRVIGLSADTSWELLLSQIEEFQPSFAALASEEAASPMCGVHTIRLLSGFQDIYNRYLELVHNLAICTGLFRCLHSIPSIPRRFWCRLATRLYEQNNPNFPAYLTLHN